MMGTELGNSLESKSCEERLRELELFSLEKRRQWGYLITARQWSVTTWGWALLPGSEKMRGNVLKLCQESFKIDIRKNSFTERIMNHGNGLPSEAVESHPWRRLRSGTLCCGLVDKVV